MRSILYTIISIYFLSSNIVLLSQSKPKPQSAMRVNLIVDASCAKCQFDKLSDKDCLLAVEIHSDMTVYSLCRFNLICSKSIHTGFIFFEENKGD